MNAGAKKQRKHGTSAAPTPRPGAMLRRARYGLQALALVLAVSAVVGFLGILTDRYSIVLDATSGRTHRLSDRTRAMLRGLDAPHEILVVANLDGVDRRAVQRTQDVLDGLSRESDNLRVSVIAIGSPDGLRTLDDAFERLVRTYLPVVERINDAIDSSNGAVVQIAASLEQLGEQLNGVAARVDDDHPNAAAVKRFFTDASSVCRIAASDAAAGVQAAQAGAASTIGRTPVPALDVAVSHARRTLGSLHGQIGQLSASLDTLVRAGDDLAPATAREEIRPLAQAAVRLRDRAARAISAMDDVPAFPLANAARAVGETSAALVIGPPRDQTGGPPRLSAVEIDAIFPRRVPGVSDRVPTPDVRARAEELFTGAIAAVNADDAPIVILTHGASEAERLTPDFAPLSGAVSRLRLRGMSVVEWAAALDPEPPSIAALDPSGKRPVVFVVMPTSGMTPEGAARMLKLSTALRALVDAGRPVLVSVTPSTLPSIGQRDPQVEMLEQLGMKVDTARPLLRQTQTPAGPVVTADLLFTTTGADHPISGAIESLRTHLPWCLPIRVEPGVRRVVPVIIAADDNRIWAESEWLRFRQTPAAQRPLLVNPPQEDSARDDGDGPWIVAAALERTLPDQRSQRVVVVGSTGWFLDELALQRVQSGGAGQNIPVCPGNLELLEASVYWLAGQNDMISQSPEAQALAVIPSIDPARLSAIRWGLIAGLPLLVLLIGGLWRLLRG